MMAELGRRPDGTDVPAEQQCTVAKKILPAPRGAQPRTEKGKPLPKTGALCPQWVPRCIHSGLTQTPLCAIFTSTFTATRRLRPS